MLKSSTRSWLVLVLTLAVTTGIARHAAAQLYLFQATWVSDDGIVSGTWRGTVDMAGEDLSGNLTITGIPGLTEARIDGTWYPGVIDFALIQWESEVAAIAGTITDDTTVAGTFVMPVAVTGTWQGQMMLIPDDVTPTPLVDDSTPEADGTPTPEVDVLTPEELALLALIEQSEQPTAASTPTEPTPEPNVTAAPTSSAPQPTPTNPDATPTPAVAPTPAASSTPTTTPTDIPTNTPTDTPPDAPALTLTPLPIPADTPTDTPTVAPTRTDTPVEVPTPTATPPPPGEPTPTEVPIPTDSPAPSPTDTPQ